MLFIILGSVCNPLISSLIIFLFYILDLILGLSTEDYKKVMTVLEQAILATDLASYFEKRDKFKIAADEGEIDWQVECL